MTAGPLEHAATIGKVLEELEIPWVLGGSLAASLIGEPRSTNDIDITLRLDISRVRELVEAVESRYYAPLETLEEAARRHGSCNLLHLESGFKVDLFFLGDSILDQLQIQRRTRLELADTDQPIWVPSPEDQVLRKLWWYRLGGEVSDRQWRDVLAILRVQHGRLDLDQLRSDAASAEVTDLLDRALDDQA